MSENKFKEINAHEMLCKAFESIIEAAFNKQPVEEYIVEINYIYSMVVCYKYNKIKYYIEHFLKEIGSNKYYIVAAAVKYLNILENELDEIDTKQESIEKALERVKVILTGKVHYDVINFELHNYKEKAYDHFYDIVDEIYEVLEPYEGTYEYIIVDRKLSKFCVLYNDVDKFNDKMVMNLQSNISTTVDMLLCTEPRRRRRYEA